MPADSLADAKSPDVKPDTFLKHFRAMREVARRKEDIAMAMNGARKAAKTDGVDMAAVKLVEKLAKYDPDEVDVLLRHARDYANWANLQIGSQLSLFAAPAIIQVPQAAQEAHTEWSADDAGYDAGRRGMLRDDNPHDPGSAQFTSWDKGWLRGLKANAEALREAGAGSRKTGPKPKGDASQTSRRTPGRPRKQADAAPTDSEARH
jgi:hypothetical protein